MASVREYLANKLGRLNYLPIVQECLTFVKDKRGKPAAKAGCNDDLVMTLGICLEVAQFSWDDEPTENIEHKVGENVGSGIINDMHKDPVVYSVHEQCLKQLEKMRAQKTDPDNFEN